MCEHCGRDHAPKPEPAKTSARDGHPPHRHDGAATPAHAPAAQHEAAGDAPSRATAAPTA